MTLDEVSRLRILTDPDGGAFPLTVIERHGARLDVFDRDPRTMRDLFAATRAHGDRIAVVYRDQRWSYDDQWDVVVRLAHALRGLGVRKGDHVGLAMRNYPEFMFGFWAGQLLGAVVIPFNAFLKSRELGELVAEARPVALLADRERIAQLSDQDLRSYGVRNVVAVRCEEEPAAQTGVVHFDELVASVDRRVAAEPPEVEIDPDDLSTIMFTSGTTAKPKGAMHSHRNHTASMLNKYIRAMRVTAQAADGPYDVQPPAPSTKVVTFPFFHIAGLNTLYTAAYSGHTLVLMYKWDADEAVRLVEAERASELAGPPFVIQTFLEAAAAADRDLSSLRIIGMGGSKPPTKVIAAIAEHFGDQVTPRTGYGLTETTSGVVSISAADFAEHPDSVGRPLPTAEVAILAEDGTPVPVGVEGEIAIRGPQVVTGYFGVSDAPEFRDGWFWTGDLGRVDESGLIYISGRLKDLVIRGGENINCAEVEGALTAHPDVVEAAALGAPHPTLGEEVVAVARLRPGSALTAEELRDFAAARLAPFKIPVRIAFSDVSLPRTPSGKIVKREVVPTLRLDHLIDPPVTAEV